MAVNDVQWELGSVTLYNSSGISITPRWGLGSISIRHEFIVVGGQPTMSRWHGIPGMNYTGRRGGW